MPTLRATYYIRQPPVDVFAAFIDVEGYPAWHPRVSAAMKVTYGVFGVGTRFSGEIRPFGRLDLEVTEYEEPRPIGFRVNANLASWHHVILVRGEYNRSRVDHIYDTKPRGPWMMLAPSWDSSSVER